MEELDGAIRKVTEFEVWREAQCLSKPKLVIELQLRGVTVDARKLRRYARREHAPQPEFEQVLCNLCGVGSVAELGLGGTFEAARHWTWMTEDEWIEEVDRRKLLKVSALGAAGMLLPVSEMVAAGQILDGRPSLGLGDVNTATDVATRLASAYASTPSPDVRRAGQAHAYTLLDLLKRSSMSDETRTRLRAVASDAAALAGYGHLDAGRFAEANTWFAMAVDLAREAGDGRLEALAAASFAMAAARELERDHAAAVTTLERAIERQLYLPPAARAWVFANAADEHAWLGDDLVSGRFLEHARTAAARVPLGEPGWGWWSTYGALVDWDGTRPQVFTASRSLLLGRPAEALELFDSALSGTSKPARRAWLHEDLTNACMALGDPERACASAVAALDEAKVYELGTFPPKIRQARANFPADWNTLAPVIDLDERLALAS